MKFLNQTNVEIKNILRSKFLMIIGILIILCSIAFPIIDKINSNNNEYDDGFYPEPMMEKMAYDSSFRGMEEEYQDSLTIDGITITDRNPFFWNIRSLMDEKEMISMDTNRFSDPAALDLMLELMDEELNFYVTFAKHITTHEDYRTEMAWRSNQYLYDKFILEHENVDTSIMVEVMQYKMGMDETMFEEKYGKLTSVERLKMLDEAETYLNEVFEVIENNDFPKYVALRIGNEQKEIENLQEQIKVHEKTITENPLQEENINQIIEDLNKRVKFIESNNIPIWEYRLEKNIIPGEDIWQNTALREIENKRNELMYIEVVTEEEFNKNRWMAEEYKTYANYQTAMQKKKDDANNAILIAQKSLDADQPDMKFVPTGARSKSVNFLDYSIFVAMFGILVGGWLVAREFQQGTIRLLMIRPKTRIKIIMSKFLAALIICLVMYIVGSAFNVITNGICFGFSDYAYPNYTVSGEVSFMMYYLPRFLACSVSILFAYAVAFMLSVLTKNIAVSISVPIACFIGSTIAMSALQYRSASWLAYTPIPYVQISSFFARWSPVKQLIERGVPINLTYGIIMLLAASVICTIISIYVFKKRDITN